MTESPASLRDRALAGQRIDDVLIIDGHCHVGPHAGFFQSSNDAAAMVRAMDRIGIDQACVFSILSVTIDARGGNDLSLQAVAAFPDRLMAYASVDPHHPATVRDELERCFDAGARGVKFHTQLADYPFDGPAYEPAFVFAHEHRLPLISHGVGSPDILRRIARTYPEAHFIVAHAGSGGAGLSGDALLRVAAEEPNVYLELCNSVARFGAFAEVVKQVGASKLIYGSDSPFLCFEYQIGRVLLAAITEEEKRGILGVTMVKLLSTRR